MQIFYCPSSEGTNAGKILIVSNALDLCDWLARFILVIIVVWSSICNGTALFLPIFGVLATWFCITLGLWFLIAYIRFEKDPLKFPKVTIDTSHQTFDTSRRLLLSTAAVKVLAMSTWAASVGCAGADNTVPLYRGHNAATDVAVARRTLLGSATFLCTQQAENFTVPAGVTSLTATLYGAAGGTYKYSESPTPAPTEAPTSARRNLRSHFADDSYSTLDRLERAMHFHALYLGLGGKGGSVSASLPVVEGQVLQIRVGCAGTSTTGGFNGGGAPGSTDGSSFGGGGASDIRIAPYDLASRVLVAGGGGGSSSYYCPSDGGDGGYPSGGDGVYHPCSAVAEAQGGSQYSGGNCTYEYQCTDSVNDGGFGSGGAACSEFGSSQGGAGGGGFFGGGGAYYGGGGGGSSYSLYSLLSYGNGVNDGDGYVTLTWDAGPTDAPTISPSAQPTPSPSALPTAAPSTSPTTKPTPLPSTVTPTPLPTSAPNPSPTRSPTAQPSVGPTATPSAVPTCVPSVAPSVLATASPSADPSPVPSVRPTVTVTSVPTSSLSGEVWLNYTGAAQTFTVPGGVSQLVVTLYGAVGGSIARRRLGGTSPIEALGTGTGGYGAMIQSFLSVTGGTQLQVFVGGAGSNSAGGFNGGGAPAGGYGGGGATDIRIAPFTLADRVLVAAGGGGASTFCPVAGGAGGYPQGEGSFADCTAAPSSHPGTQTAGGAAPYDCSNVTASSGSFGRGGDSCGSSGGGGGGGYYGGSGGGTVGGAGGSSYALYTITANATGVNPAQGFARLQWTIEPTAVPTITPTASPSTGPPSRAPSTKPSPAPSAVPTAPTCSPTLVPTLGPTVSPSARPTIAPTAAPSAAPTLTPSTSPTAVPTRPTTAPTISACPAGTRYLNAANPEVCIDCAAGTFSNTFGGAAECTPCPPGQYAPSNRSTECTPCESGTYATGNGTVTCTPCGVGTFSTAEGADSASICQACPAGQFSDTEGSSACSLCAAGQYADQEGSAQCTICPANRVTAGTGAASAADCLNPAANFAQGVLALAAACLFAAVYVLRGRMNAVAFGRKRHLQEAGKTYIYLIRAIGRVPLVARPIQASRFEKFLILCMFFVGAVLVFGLTTFVMCFLIFGQVFFSAMIIWRNVRVSIDISFVERVTEAVGRLDEIVGIPVKYLFGWVFVVLELLASLGINLSAVQVTCVGSQAPIVLLIDLVLFVAIVVLIECDVAAFLATSFFRAHREYRSVIANSRSRNTVDYPSSVKAKLWLLSNIETGIFNSNLVVNVLHYAVSFISVGEFFQYYGRHASTPACDDINGVRNIDTALAVLSSIFVYCMLPIMMYTVSKLLVPRLLAKDRAPTHSLLTEGFGNQQVTLSYSCVPSIDYFVSWRFKWAYNVLHQRKHGDKEQYMFLLKDDPPVDPPTGIGICPVLSTTNEEFQNEWMDECQERLPHVGFSFKALVQYAHVVLKNFRTFAAVVLGIWDMDSVRKFNIINTLVYNGFDIAQYLEQPQLENSSDTPVYASFGKLCYRSLCCLFKDVTSDKFVPDDGGESRLQVAALVAAELSTRATIFLLFPFGSVITTYVNFTAANPIFCRRAKKLSKLLPELLMFDSDRLADKRVRMMGSYAKWKVSMMSVYIFVTESRLIKYCFGVMCCAMALSIDFYPVLSFLALGVAVIVAYSMIAAIYPIIVLANILEVHDEDKVTPSSTAPGTPCTDVESSDPASIQRMSLTREPSLRRQSSGRSSELQRPVSAGFIRQSSTGSTAADRPRSGNYNFYSGYDEDSDEDNPAPSQQAGAQQALGTAAVEVELTEVKHTVPIDHRPPSGSAAAVVSQLSARLGRQPSGQLREDSISQDRPTSIDGSAPSTASMSITTSPLGTLRPLSSGEGTPVPAPSPTAGQAGQPRQRSVRFQSSVAKQEKELGGIVGAEGGDQHGAASEGEFEQVGPAAQLEAHLPRASAGDFDSIYDCRDSEVVGVGANFNFGGRSGKR